MRAVVVGASSGLGRCIGVGLGKRGAQVALLARRRERLEGAAAEAGEGALAIECDVTEPSSVSSAIGKAAADLGGIDALVYTPAIGPLARLVDTEVDTWRRTFDINVTGPLLGIQAVVPLMAPGSTIVNVCSVAALSGHVAAAYTASKWALRGLTRTASLELGARGIRVNAVMPGLVETPLMENASPAFRVAALAEIPLGRTGTVDDIAPLMVFLVSDASAYMNGAELVVDGGLTAHVSHKGIADAIGGASS